MILYACTNQKYLIPISVPILSHTTPQDRIIPHAIYNFALMVEGDCNWSVRCVVCVCCNFVLDRVRSGFVDVVVVINIMVECVSIYLVSWLCL